MSKNKKIISLRKKHNEIYRLCMRIYKYDLNDDLHSFYEKLLYVTNKMIDELENCANDNLDKMPLIDNSKIFENDEKCKYMNEIIKDSYYFRDMSKYDFGGEFNIWGKQHIGAEIVEIDSSDKDVENLMLDNNAYLSFDEAKTLLDDIIAVFDRNSFLSSLKEEILIAFAKYGIKLL